MAQYKSTSAYVANGLLVCGIGDEDSVKKAIESDINVRMLTDLAPTVIATSCPEGNLTYLNTFWYDFTGCEELDPGKVVWKDFIHPEDVVGLAKDRLVAIANGLEFKLEFRMRGRNGDYKWFQSNTRPILDHMNEHIVQWLTVSTPIQDIKDAQEMARQARADLEAKVTERTQELKESQQQVLEEIDARQKATDALRQAQKMESVGQLTGGIAHDFNNMLTVIIGNLELTKMTLAASQETVTGKRMERQVNMAIEAALKAEKLTAQLLAFSRKSRLHPERLDVNEVVLGVQDIVQRAVGVTILVDIDLEENSWLCLSDKNQLESAILNLSINGRDAMPDGGTICIKTRNRTLDDSRFVSVSVTDTGTGMTQDTIEKAFEPFFTTKDVGKGSGLGLSMVYGFCQQSNGKVFIDSVLGKGTTIEMLFPYTAGETTRETNQEEDFHYDENKASILVVDDEPGVRELAASALSDMGYNVMSAEDGARALEVINNPDIPIDLLFTDVVMPNGIDGFALAKAAAAIRPEMPIVFTTGHAEVALRELKKDLSQKIKVLGKPYRINDLSSMIAGELAARLG